MIKLVWKINKPKQRQEKRIGRLTRRRLSRLPTTFESIPTIWEAEQWVSVSAYCKRNLPMEVVA